MLPSFDERANRPQNETSYFLPLSKVYEIFKELRFNKYIERFNLENSDTVEEKDATNLFEYEELEEINKVVEVLIKIAKTNELVYSFETKDVVDRLHEEGYKVLAVEQTENSISLEKLSLNKDEKYAIILGNEVKGVQQEVVDLCDETVEIPQFGTKHSLNVSVAGALTIWNIFTQLKVQ